jgi:hypothetical protein
MCGDNPDGNAIGVEPAVIEGWSGGRLLEAACVRCGLTDWLGGRDSNPDNHVQSVVSYR